MILDAIKTLEGASADLLVQTLRTWQKGVIGLSDTPPENFDPADALLIMAREFHGKTPVPAGQKTVRANGGAPGTGKTRFMAGLRQQFTNAVYFNPDEGFLSYTRAFADAVAGDASVEGRLAAYDPLRAASQYGSALMLNRAYAEGYDILLDSTLQSPFAMKMLDTLKAAGYRIEVDGFCAPLDVSLARNEMRTRVLPEDHITGKRTNFLEMLPEILKRADRFSLSWNPSNDREPVKALEITGGHLSYINPAALAALIDDINEEIPETAALLGTYLEGPAPGSAPRPTP